jgi:hypothetical protein
MDLGTMLRVTGLIGKVTAIYISLNEKIAVAAVKLDVEKKISELKCELGQIRSEPQQKVSELIFNFLKLNPIF